MKKLKAMDFEGRVIQFIGETSGTTKAGKPWKKKEWLVETFGQYPRKVKIQSFNERADSLNIELGKDYILSVDLESREFNGRWYTDVSVFRVQEYNAPQTFGGQPQGYGVGQPQGYPGGMQNPQPQNGYGSQQYGSAQPGPFGGDNSQAFSPSVGESDEDLPF